MPAGRFVLAVDGVARALVEEPRHHDEVLVDALGEADGAWARQVFHVHEAGTFEHGLSTLRRLRDPPHLTTGRRKARPGSSRPRLQRNGSAMTRARNQRPAALRLSSATTSRASVRLVCRSSMLRSERDLVSLAVSAAITEIRPAEGNDAG